jgi:hypothetical protein
MTSLLTLLLCADPVPRPAEPAEIGAIHYFDAATNKLQPLEYRRGVTGNRQSGFTNREILEVPGIKSPVRFKAGTPLEFIVRVLIPASNGTVAVWPAPQLIQKGSDDSQQQIPSRIALVFKDPTNYDLLKLDPNPKSGTGS